MNLIIRLANVDDEHNLSKLISKFREELLGLKRVELNVCVEESKLEFKEYMNKSYPIFVAINENNDLLGYLVCKVEDNIVWAESLFVLEEHRRSNIASKLYDRAEELAKSLGEDQVYNWIHPNNHNIIKFLSKRGYNVLNLIEVRKASLNENLNEHINVGEYQYKY